MKSFETSIARYIHFYDLMTWLFRFLAYIASFSDDFALYMTWTLMMAGGEYSTEKKGEMGAAAVTNDLWARKVAKDAEDAGLRYVSSNEYH